MIKTKINRLKLVVLAFSLLATNFFFLANFASAATLTNSYIRLSRMKVSTGGSTPNDVRVVFKTTASGGATGFTVNFNGTDSGTSQWTDASNGGAVATSGMTVTALSGCDVSATAAGGTPTVSGSGATLTVTGVTALTASTTYCWDITKASTGVVTTPSNGGNTAGIYHPTITETGGATDSVTVAVNVISNDQVVVNATVPATFNFAISACTPDNFTTSLSPTTHVSTTGCTITVNTNAKNGWYTWAKDANAGLTSTTAGHTIASVSAGAQSDLNTSHGTEGYGIGVTSLSQGGTCAGTCGTTSVSTGYDSTASGGVNGLVGGLSSSVNTAIVSSNGVSNGASFTVKARANINATTPPATDYTDTITYVGAGYF